MLWTALINGKSVLEVSEAGGWFIPVSPWPLTQRYSSIKQDWPHGTAFIYLPGALQNTHTRGRFPLSNNSHMECFSPPSATEKMVMTWTKINRRRTWKINATGRTESFLWFLIAVLGFCFQNTLNHYLAIYKAGPQSSGWTWNRVNTKQASQPVWLP